MSTSRIDNLGMGITVETITHTNGLIYAVFKLDGRYAMSVQYGSGSRCVRCAGQEFDSPNEMVRLAMVCLFAADRLTQMNTVNATDSVSVVEGDM